MYVLASPSPGLVVFDAAGKQVLSIAELQPVRIGDEVTHEWHYDSQVHSVTLTVPDAVKNWTVHITQ